MVCIVAVAAGSGPASPAFAQRNEASARQVPAEPHDTEIHTTARQTSAAPSTASAPAARNTAPPEPAASAPAAQGADVFRAACVACHGEDGRGGPGGGAPLDQVTDPALVVAMVNDGRGSMPPLSDMLTAEQIRAVAAYVTTDLFK